MNPSRGQVACSDRLTSACRRCWLDRRRRDGECGRGDGDWRFGGGGVLLPRQPRSAVQPCDGTGRRCAPDVHSTA